MALPTGFGKSIYICYACLPKIYDHLMGRKGSIAVVISPLLSLMNDQLVTKFNKMGLPSGFITRGMPIDEVSKKFKRTITKRAF